jgi:hypothetical protein
MPVAIQSSVAGGPGGATVSLRVVAVEPHAEGGTGSAMRRAPSGCSKFVAASGSAVAE